MEPTLGDSLTPPTLTIPVAPVVPLVISRLKRIVREKGSLSPPGKLMPVLRAPGAQVDRDPNAEPPQKMLTLYEMDLGPWGLVDSPQLRVMEAL